MDGPRPVPTHETILDAVAWAQEFLAGCMRDWPEHQLEVMRLLGDDDPSHWFPRIGMGETDAIEERDQRRGRIVATMQWRLGPDEALIVEFQDYDGFWMFTNMGVFWNSMDYAYRNVSYTPSRAVVDSDGKVRLIMAHNDPGYHNWLDTQGYETGFLMYRNVLSREIPRIETTVVKSAELTSHLPNDCRKVSADERLGQLRARFDGIRRRYRI
jgi:hypothetical protein